MSERRLFLDRGIGESRGVVTLDGRAERLLIVREGRSPVGQIGAHLVARVRKVEPALASAFLDLGEGVEALLSYKPDARPIEGQALEVQVRSEARAGKLATVRVIGPAEGAPRLLSEPLSLAEQLAAFAKDAKITEGRPARQAADEAEAEALETVHPLPGGGTVAIEPTRALVAIDVDVGERKGQDAKRALRQTNMSALAAAARLLRLKGLGGLVVIDLAGRGHDGTALLAAVRTAFAADNPGLAIGPVSRFGTMELTVPRRGRGALEILGSGAQLLSDLSIALRLIRRIEAEGAAQPGARLGARCAAPVADAAAPLAVQLAARIGARFTIVTDPVLRRDQFEVTAT